MEEKESVYQRFHRELRHMLRTHHAVCDRRARVFGLHPAQHSLLFHLAHRGEYTSQKELAEHMHISPAALTVSLGKLEAAGYITKEASASDSRANIPEITEKGKKLLSESKELFDSLDREMFAGIEEEALVPLIDLLAQMTGNLINMKEGEENK